MLRSVRQDVRLRLVLTDSSDGNGELRWEDRYEHAARRLGVDRFVDVVHTTFLDLPGELARASIVVSPRGKCPGVPQKLLNYMASGVPIVSFAGSAKTIVHGETGWIVPDGDVQAFAAGMDIVLRDEGLASGLGSRARETAVRSHSWGGVARRVGAIYERLVLTSSWRVSAPSRP